jgi:hypothetical protein
MASLGLLPGTKVGTAEAINDAGVVIGECASSWDPVGDDPPFRGFVWTGGIMQPLVPLAGDLGALGHDINGGSVIVGSSSKGEGARAVKWTSPMGRSPIDLNSLLPAGSPWLLTTGTAINKEGDIVGLGQLTLPGGGVEEHAWLLTDERIDHPLGDRAIIAAVLRILFGIRAGQGGIGIGPGGVPVPVPPPNPVWRTLSPSARDAVLVRVMEVLARGLNDAQLRNRVLGSLREKG